MDKLVATGEPVMQRCRPGAGTPRIVVAMVGACLTLAYVLPNHAPPWQSFWHELFVAAALAGLALATLLGRRHTRGWHWPDLVILGLLLIPPIQYLSGAIPFLQTAWMNSLYLLGLLLAMRTGVVCEVDKPTKVLWILLAAVWLAAIASVAMQWVQWLVMGPGESTLWLYRSAGGRPAANLGQPNSLASVIVLALLGTYALWRRALFSAVPALVVAAYLISGLALTQSRTGLLNAFLLGAALLLWHRRRPVPGLPLALTGLALLLAGAFVGYAAFGSQFSPGAAQDLSATRATVGSRPMAWQLAVTSIGQHPWFGHGWGRSFVAQLDGALVRPALHEVFLSVHNLFLDLALWNGLPIAVGLAIGLLLWLRECVRRMEDETTLLLTLFVGVLLVHAMLEFPLTYAYFLLPAGVAMGALNQRIGLKVVWRAPAAVGAALLAAAVLGLALTVRDYLRVEQSYRDLLLEKARIISPVPGAPPDVLVLTSLRDLIVLSRVVPDVGMSASEISWMRDVASTHPGPGNFATLATALALNGQATEAQQWVDKLCRIFTEPQCAVMAEDWALRAQAEPELRAVHWP